MPEGSLGKLEDIEGRRPRTKLFAGEPVLEVKLLSLGESGGGAAPQIPVGYRSVPVSVDEVSGGAAMILPGDRVDVLVYAKEGKEIRTTMTKTILQNIKIFAVDSQWTLEADEGGQSIRAKTISLLLTPEQTERVMLAAELGKIRLALRSPSDSEEAELPEEGHQVGQIFGESEIADNEEDSFLGLRDLPQPQMQMPFPMATNAMVPEPPSHTVRVISGSQVQEVVMQSQADVSEPGMPNGTSSKSGSAASFFWKIISSPSSMTGDKGGSAQDSGAKSDGDSGAPSSDLDSSQAEPDDTRISVEDD